MINIFLALYGCKPAVPFDHSIVPVQDEGTVVLSISDLQEGLEHVISVLAIIHPSALIEVEGRLTNQDTWCPEVFEGVSNTNAWNEHCDNNQGTVFAGRSQSLSAVELTVDDVFYSQYATFISSFVIESEDTYLMMNGYGDFYVQEEFVWMELVGTYAYAGPDLSWSLSQQSTAIQVFADSSSLSIEGGVSNTEDFPDGLASVRFKQLNLDESSVVGDVVFQTTQGEIIEIAMNGALLDCISVQDGELCYDWTSVKEREW